jgi:hypothetical protein
MVQRLSHRESRRVHSDRLTTIAERRDLVDWLKAQIESERAERKRLPATSAAEIDRILHTGTISAYSNVLIYLQVEERERAGKQAGKSNAERSAVEILRAARERISDPESWTRGCEARTISGEGLNLGFEPGAVRWCMSGAVEAELGRAITCWPLLEADEFGRLLNEGTGQEQDGVGVWNDNHTHAEVLAAFDRAIELAEASS